MEGGARKSAPRDPAFQHIHEAVDAAVLKYSKRALPYHVTVSEATFKTDRARVQLEQEMSAVGLRVERWVVGAGEPGERPFWFEFARA